MNAPQLPSTDALVQDVRRLIDEARVTVATAVNFAMTKLYWQIGHRVHTEILAGERAEYGNQIVAALAQQLVVGYGQGFSEKNLRHMINFAQSFPSEQIVSTLSRELSWSHELLRLDQSGIRVAEYLTELPAKEVLAHKLHTAIQQAQARLTQREVTQKQTNQE